MLVLSVKGQHVDSVRITGQVSAENGDKVTTEFTKVYLNPIDPEADYFSAVVDAQGVFNLSVPVHAPTMYMFKYRDYKMEVLLCPSEPVFKISIIANNREIHNMRVVDSKEYEALRNFKKLNKGFIERLPGWLKDSNGELIKELDAHNSVLEYLALKYKGTYTAQTLAPMAEMPEINTGKPGIAQLRERFFEHADLTDTMLYRTLEFNDQISTYLDYFADTSTAGRLGFINMMASKARKNYTAEKDILLLLLSNFTDAKRENYLISLVQWARAQKWLNDEQPVMSAKFQLLAKTIPGAKAPAVTGQDLYGKPLSLSDIFPKNKLTLIIFWSSECPHCRKEVPQVLKLYQKYHDKGLEVFAASTEPSAEKWKQFVANNRLNWQNIKLPEESQAHADYCIQYTPTFVVIDNSGTILRRFIGLDDLDGIILKALETGK